MIDFDKIEAHFRKLEKSKQPTQKLNNMSRIIELMRDICDKNDDLRVEYDYTNGVIILQSYALDVNYMQMDTWREIMSLIDMLGIDVRNDDKLYVEMVVKDVFII